MQKTLQELGEDLKEVEEQMFRWKTRREQLEEEILEHPEIELEPDKVHKLGPFRIETGYNRKWDQGRLQRLYEEFGDDLPFKRELKEERRRSKLIEGTNMWGAIREALTLTDKKPKISLL